MSGPLAATRAAKGIFEAPMGLETPKRLLVLTHRVKTGEADVLQLALAHAREFRALLGAVPPGAKQSGG